MRTGCPIAHSRRSEPAAFVRMAVRQPAAAAVRTAWATTSASWPSYRWTRPRKTSTRLSCTWIERTSAAWPPAEGGGKPGSSAKRHGRPVADGVRAPPPARAQHDERVVARHAGQAGELGRRVGGAGEGLRHAPGSYDRPVPRDGGRRS